jgi:hypothetical protein
VILRLISTMLAFTGFCITALVSLLTGGDPLVAVVKSIAVFFVLWAVFSLIAAVINSKLPDEESEEAREVSSGFGVDVYIPSDGSTPEMNNDFDQSSSQDSTDSSSLLMTGRG